MKKVFLAGLLLIALNSCNNEGGKSTQESIVVSPVSYGNGVYYFKCTERTFAISLADFIEKSVNNNQELKAISPDGAVSGNDKGYFVVIGIK